MDSISRKYLSKILLIVFAFIFSECANQLPPEGGEVDKIPPSIIEVYPADGTTNFSDNYFELGFSEYVEKRTVKEAIFISPAIDGDLDLSWSGKYVRVYFPGALRDSATYVVTIGTDVEDYNNNNKMAEAFTFTFSTGDQIDRRNITGQIFDDSRQGIMLFGYKLSETEPNPLEQKPDYISQTGADGTFKLAGLGAGSYRVFAVRDEYRDLLYQPDQDDIGIPFKDVKLEISDTLFSGLNFFLTKIDTVKPRLLEAAMTDQYHILASFSEELNSKSIKPINFYLFDSTSNKRSQIRYAFKGNTKIDECVLVPFEIIPIDNKVFLFADSISDKSGNTYYSDFTQLTVSDKSDTSKPDIYKLNPPAGSKDVDFLGSSFKFEFNDAFDVVKVKDAIIFSDTLKNNVPFDFEFLDDASFKIIPTKKLEMSKDYILTINLNFVKDAAGNYYDSLYRYNFKTITGIEFTGVKGIVSTYDADKNLKLVLKSLEKKELEYKTTPLQNGQFNLERILPGKYSLYGYYDLDSTDTYFKGSLKPFIQSEQFSFYPDTLKLRARWIETDIKFNFNPN
jgi:hypothetical protein